MNMAARIVTAEENNNVEKPAPFGTQFTSKDILKYISQRNKEITEDAKNSRRTMAERIKKNHKLLKMLQSIGLHENATKYDIMYGLNTQTITEPKKWGEIHKLFGKLEKGCVYVKDSVENEVYVEMIPVAEEYSSLRFRFERKLKETDKCKIQKTESYSVVCSN